MIESPVWWPFGSQSMKPPWRTLPYSSCSCKRNNADIKLVVIGCSDWLRAPYVIPELSIGETPSKKFPICYAQSCTIAFLLQLHPSNAEIVYIINYVKYSIAYRFCILIHFWIGKLFTICSKNIINLQNLLISYFLMALNFKAKINELKFNEKRGNGH